MQFSIRLIDGTTGNAREAAGVFSDEEARALRLFTGAADDLHQTRWVENGMPSGLELSWSDESGFSGIATLPPWDDVMVFLHRFRPFGLQDERTFLPRVCGWLAREIVDSDIRRVLQIQRERFSGRHFQSQVRISTDGVILNSEDTLNQWLNAFEYHRDPDKQDFIESIHQLFPLDASKAIFLQLMADRALAVFNVAALVSVLLGTKQQVQIGGRREPKDQRAG